jgi:hypothetical protein
MNSDDKKIGIVLTTVSIVSAILAALQKFFRYSEKAENAKDMAKNYARLARKIENTMVLVESDAVKMPSDEFIKFINTVQNDSDLLQETNDIPDELIVDKNKYTEQIKHLNQIKEKPSQSTQVTIRPPMHDLELDDIRNLNRIMAREVKHPPLEQHKDSLKHDIEMIKMDILNLSSTIDEMKKDGKNVDRELEMLDEMRKVLDDKNTELQTISQ